jgi:acyl phosphate:glycerol-3-phosphate acyltransferase
MDSLIVLLTALAGYILGSLSFSRIITKIVAPKLDLSAVEVPIEGMDATYRFSAMSATTVSVKLGPRIGCAIGLLDMLKAFIPVLAVRLLFPEQPYFLITALAAVAGHNWPVFHRFVGGRGVSPAYGGLFAVDWLGAIISSGLGMTLGMVVFKDLVISYLGGLWLLIPWMWLRHHRLDYVIYAVLLNVLFTVAMIPEIREIIRLRKQRGGKGELSSMMNMMPMGKMMLKIGQKLKIMK